MLELCKKIYKTTYNQSLFLLLWILCNYLVTLEREMYTYYYWFTSTYVRHISSQIIRYGLSIHLMIFNSFRIVTIICMEIIIIILSIHVSYNFYSSDGNKKIWENHFMVHWIHDSRLLFRFLHVCTLYLVTTCFIYLVRVTLCTRKNYWTCIYMLVSIVSSK